MLNKQEKQYPAFKLIFQRVEQIGAIVETDLRKLKHDPFELFVRMIQPAMWLLIFGQAMEKARAMPVGYSSYLDYLAPGILAQSILFIAIFYGISLIWERDMGILHKIMVSPAPRSVLIMGRALSAGIRGLPQIVMIYLLSSFLGVNVRFEILPLIGTIMTVLIGGAIFSTFSLIMASFVKKRERFMGLGQLMTMPLFFASNALYPLAIMPKWLQMLSIFNPLTYQVNALRNFMITGDASYYALTIDFTVSIVCFIALVAIASKVFPRILY